MTVDVGLHMAKYGNTVRNTLGSDLYKPNQRRIITTRSRYHLKEFGQSQAKETDLQNHSGGQSGA